VSFVNKGIVLIVFGGLSMGLFYISISKPFTPNTELLCQNNLKQLYYFMEYSNARCDSPIRQLLNETNRSCDLSITIGKFISDKLAADSRLTCSFIVNSRLIDTWNRPVNICWRTNMPAETSSELLKSTDMDVIIWSSGENGVNEYGNGDDIFYRQYHFN